MGHFWSGSLCLFGFHLPVSSVSNFHPDTGGRRWSLVQVHLFSRAAGREGRCRQMSLACVGSTHSVPATLGLSPLTGVCFPHLHCSGSRLLYMERALHWVRFPFSGTPQKRGLGWACILCLPHPSSSGSQELDGRTLPGVVRLLHSAVPDSVSARARRVCAPCVCSRELASSRDPPGRCRPSRISGSLWLETRGLFAVW